MKETSIILIFLITLLGCSNSESPQTVKKIEIQQPIIIEKAKPFFHELDNKKDTFSFLIDSSMYFLEVNDSPRYFEVGKRIGNSLKPLLKEPNYYSNQSSMYVKDANNDDFLDIVWLRRFQEHTYLFNPKINNFVEIGEYGKVDTLRDDNKIIYFKGKLPLLYYVNEEKALQIHSELFVIDENYQKISFAVIDNFDDDYVSEEYKIYTYVPPYRGKYSKYNIWNSGKIFEIVRGRKSRLNEIYIKEYWLKNVKKLLPYGAIFKVRKEKKLMYFK
jgi:hypothetical protein